jgi:hypothetical protein
MVGMLAFGVDLTVPYFPVDNETIGGERGFALDQGIRHPLFVDVRTCGKKVNTSK